MRPRRARTRPVAPAAVAPAGPAVFALLAGFLGGFLGGCGNDAVEPDEARAGFTPTIVAAAPAEDAIVFGQVPEFELLDQTGAPVTGASLAGSPWVLATIFTTCTGPCPSVTREVARLGRRLEGTDVHFVSVTVDPERDSPAALAAYAATFDADPARWSFLTGEPDQVASLVRDGFKMPYARLDEPDPVTGDSITHDVRLAVVDADGGIRGWYRSDEPAEMDLLVRRVTFLAGE